jgi:hypothetical protein
MNRGGASEELLRARHERIRTCNRTVGYERPMNPRDTPYLTSTTQHLSVNAEREGPLDPDGALPTIGGRQHLPFLAQERVLAMSDRRRALGGT